MIKDVVTVGVLRTPIGCFRGALAGRPAMELGSLVVKALIERTSVPIYAMDEVILSQVLTAEAGQNLARQSAAKGGLPNSVSTITINDVYGSGLKALYLTTQAIQCGEADIVVTGDQENTSRAPHVLTNSRTGTQLGNSQLVDSLIYDGLQDAFNDYHIGITAKNLAHGYDISRQLQDTYAFSPQQKAQTTIDVRRLKNEIVPVVTQSDGQTLVASTDEQPHTDTSAEGLARLNPSFDSFGSVAAGNASSINNGATAVMMMSEAKARVLNLPVLAHIRAFASVGVDPALMGIAPMYTTRRYLERVGWQLAEIDLIKANKAFAAQALSADETFEWDERRANVDGGVIALGHPIDASGCRILVPLVHEMARHDAREGLAALRIGGGRDVILTIERDR